MALRAPSSPNHPKLLSGCEVLRPCPGIQPPSRAGPDSVLPHLNASSQVRMAILRIISQLALSGYQDRIKGWGLKYVSVQLTLSTYKLVSGPMYNVGSSWASEMASKAVRAGETVPCSAHSRSTRRRHTQTHTYTCTHTWL